MYLRKLFETFCHPGRKPHAKQQQQQKKKNKEKHKQSFRKKLIWSDDAYLTV